MNPHLVFLDFGLFEIHWYGFLIGLAVLSASIIYSRLRAIQGIDVFSSLTDVILATPAAFLLARISYCWFRKSSFSGRMMEIFSLSLGGYSLTGAIAGIVIVLLFRARRLKVSLLPLLDSAVPALSFAIALGRLASITSGEETGFAVTSAFARIFSVWSEAEKEQVLWVGFFEGMTAFLITTLTLVLFVNKYQKNKRGLSDGCVALCFMVSYGLSQALLESMRSDSLFMNSLGFVRIDQIISILLAVSSIVVIIVRNIKECGFFISTFVYIFLCIAALTIAVVCEFSLNFTYLTQIYTVMGSALAAMWMIAARLFYLTATKQSESCAGEKMTAKDDGKGSLNEMKKSEKEPSSHSPFELSDSVAESLIADINASVGWKT